MRTSFDIDANSIFASSITLGNSAVGLSGATVTGASGAIQTYISNTIGITGDIGVGVELVNRAITGSPDPYILSMEYGSLVTGGSSVASDDTIPLSGGGFNIIADTTGGIWHISASFSARITTSSARDSDAISLEVGYDEGSNTRRRAFRTLSTKTEGVDNNYDVELSINQISRVTGAMQLSSLIKYFPLGGDLSNLTIKIYHWNVSAMRIA